MIRKPKNTEPTRFPVVACYRKTATGRRQDSLAFQQQQVRRWARDHGVEIIRKSIDAGPSAQDVHNRPAFQEMMNDRVKQRDEFQYVLCSDLSRLGRFANLDYAAGFSAMCQEYPGAQAREIREKRRFNPSLVLRAGVIQNETLNNPEFASK